MEKDQKNLVTKVIRIKGSKHFWQKFQQKCDRDGVVSKAEGVRAAIREYTR